MNGYDFEAKKRQYEEQCVTLVQTFKSAFQSNLK